MVDETGIKTILEDRLIELAERVEEIDDDLREHEEDDFGDRAIETAGDEVMEELGNAYLQEIQQIRAALVRFDKGTYGTARVVDNRSASIASRQFPTRHCASPALSRSD